MSSSIAHYSLTRTSVPVGAVSLAEARSYLRIRHVRDDAVVQIALDAAIEEHEAQTGRQLMSANYRLDLDGFPMIIRLKRPPLASVTSLKYIDTAGDEQTLTEATDFLVDAGSPDVVARIMPAYGKWWPTTRDRMNAVSVTYQAGYGTEPTLVPARDRQRILANMELLFRNSSGMTGERSPKTVRMVLQQLAWQRRVIPA